MALLEVKKLGISFGGLRAVDEFSVKIEKGELYGLIGPNGAGKTTVFNLLTGVYKPTDGSIILDGVDITGKNTIQINHAGIARTFQNIRLVSNLSVIDNVKVGLHNHYKSVNMILTLFDFQLHISISIKSEISLSSISKICKFCIQIIPFKSLR